VKQKSERRDNAAIMYKGKSKSGEVMFNLIVKAGILPKPDENGNIRLTGFLNSYKTKNEQPDVLFYEARKPNATSARPVRQKSAPPVNEQSEESGGDDWF
jgi:hypothetical protein